MDQSYIPGDTKAVIAKWPLVTLDLASAAVSLPAADATRRTRTSSSMGTGASGANRRRPLPTSAIADPRRRARLLT